MGGGTKTETRRTKPSHCKIGSIPYMPPPFPEKEIGKRRERKTSGVKKNGKKGKSEKRREIRKGEMKG